MISAFPPPQPLLTATGAVIVCWSSLVSNFDPQGIYAYDQADGHLLWSTTTILYSGFGEVPLTFSVYDSPVINSDNLLVAIAREHVIVALDATDGSQQWLWPNDSTLYQSILPGDRISTHGETRP